MNKEYSLGKSVIKRRSFSRIPRVLELPNLLEIQNNSFDEFIQAGVSPEKRENKRLEEVFRSIFPITNYKGEATLEYVGYELGTWICKCGEYKGLGGSDVVCEKCKKEVVHKPKYTVEESRQRGVTYADSLKIIVRLVLKEKDEATEAMEIREIKEQKIYLGELPLMTEVGTFIINGTERIIVSQLHRSPGVFFVKEKGKGIQQGKMVFSARIIPHRGSWLDFEFDTKEVCHVRIDRRKKFPVSILLKALGYGDNELLAQFYQFQPITYNPSTNEFFTTVTEFLHVLPYKPIEDLVDLKSGEALVKAGRKFTKGAVKKCISAGIKQFKIDLSQLGNEFIAQDVINEETGEVLLEANAPVDEAAVESIRANKIKKFETLGIDDQLRDTSFRDTLASDGVLSSNEALREIYKRMRPGDPPTAEAVKLFFHNLFFNEKRYDLSEVGRKKINEKLTLNTPPNQRLLTKEDMLATVKYLFDLRRGTGSRDDIDHLGNRRVRAVGESISAQFRIGMVRMEKAIVERMNIMDLAACMPHDLINSKPVTAAIKEFFGSSQLSQFMDETNPLSALTHKRRLSSLGPGGLARERAGFEVRDVHPTHYGRICPVETPEGPNIGLIASLSTFARVNKYGFIESPSRKVINGKVTDEVVYHTATDEYKHHIAQANAPLDEKGRFVSEDIIARYEGEVLSVPRDKIDYMDVSPNQLFSIAAALIPFLENDDANRALMGSNMQRQAVPSIRTEAPLVGTGMEKVAARYSGTLVLARNDGEVINVDSRRIVVRVSERSVKNGQGTKVDIYNITKFGRSNQNTCINQKPLVAPGHKVKKGDVLADGQSTDRGDLALGRNLLVAFMPWRGYNFEDAIIISENVIKKDYFTSVHIEEFEVEARDTKYGKEEITRDVPGLSEESLRNIDESGMVRIGAKVTPGDILVCKLTPKGETLLSPEEKLLKAIFGEKAGNVMDTSFRVPPGVEGTVVDVRIFSRSGAEKDARALANDSAEKSRIESDFDEQIRIVREERDNRIRALLEGKTAEKAVTASGSKEVLVEAKKSLTASALKMVDGKDLLKIQTKENLGSKADEIEESFAEIVRELKVELGEKLAKLEKGDELAPGVIKLVKVHVAVKRRLQVGDKMAGRHGNKGVISVIVPEEDMPMMDDGTPVDIVLNPLGVPSRMNVGQLMETSLGMAARMMGEHFETPVFDGAREDVIRKLLKDLGLPEDGMLKLRDGRMGEYFDQKAFVGIIYMLKLHHLVEDKIHARSTGPYSLVTQQPLGGKAQFGGQRLGEMEVWAMEAYGAAHTLQEMLTVKSDDVEGRKRMYEAIVKGDNTLQPGLPESFNVLVKELQSLCLDISLDDNNKKKPVL